MGKIKLSERQFQARLYLLDLIDKNLTFSQIKENIEHYNELKIYSNSSDILKIEQKYKSLKYIHSSHTSKVKESTTELKNENHIIVTTKVTKVKQTRELNKSASELLSEGSSEPLESNFNNQVSNKTEVFLERKEEEKTEIKKIDINFTSELSRKQVPLIEKCIDNLLEQSNTIAQEFTEQLKWGKEEIKHLIDKHKDLEVRLNNIVNRQYRYIQEFLTIQDDNSKQPEKEILQNKIKETERIAKGYAGNIDELKRTINSSLYIYSKYNENIESSLRSIEINYNQWGKLNAIVKGIVDNDVNLVANHYERKEVNVTNDKDDLAIVEYLDKWKNDIPELKEELTKLKYD